MSSNFRILGSNFAAATIAVAVGTLAYLHTVSVSAHEELGSKPHHIDTPMNLNAVMQAFRESKAGDMELVEPSAAATATECTDGAADIYACSNVDLRAFMPRSAFGGDRSNDEINDIWGWTDPTNGKEYAIVGRVFGTSFIDISQPESPVYLGELPTHGTFGSSWRDVKVYNNHAFIVSEASNHGMQVFDLTQLRGLTGSPRTFVETAHYRGFGSAHNIAINEESGIAYGVGTDKCNGGLAIVDVINPASPQDMGCYSGDGYTHDAQCVVYHGPDTLYQGHEICFASNEDTLTIVDVNNGPNPTLVSKTSYVDRGYTHQGWLTPDHAFFVADDELDELDFGHTTRTRIFDVRNLQSPDPVPVQEFYSEVEAIDHNQYIQGRFVYQANYRAGLRVLELSYDTGGVPSLTEYGFFDVYPGSDAAQFNGAWSNYPFFASGNVIVSHIEQGLFILRPNLDRVHFNAPLSHNAVLSGIDVDVQIIPVDHEPGAPPTVWWQLDDDPAMLSVGVQDIPPGQHRLTAYMTDEAGNTTSSEILVTFETGGSNNPPIANLLADPETVAEGEVVNLDARTSSDPDADDLTYSWQVVTRPKGKNRTNFVDLGGGQAVMTPGKAGLYEIQVTVSDGQESAQALVSVTVTADGGGGEPKPCRNPRRCS